MPYFVVNMKRSCYLERARYGTSRETIGNNNSFHGIEYAVSAQMTETFTDHLAPLYRLAPPKFNDEFLLPLTFSANS